MPHLTLKDMQCPLCGKKGEMGATFDMCPSITTWTCECGHCWSTVDQEQTEEV